ncbi:MAG TPA: hypothetical protein VMF66_07095, partial [Candidatus Acidoferrum sp.]|nr:hypothetical protein [Candidatus Acidoferrum sp.]
MSATEFLAHTLMDAGRLPDALPLLQELFNAQTPNLDVAVLLNCAARLKQDQIILDTCEELHKRGVRRWELIEFEAQYLEEYNFTKAITRLQEFITTNPTHKLAKLRLAIIATRYNQGDLVHVSEEILPEPERLPVPYAVPLVHLLQWHGQGRLAVEYAYRVLRCHYSEFETHKAYLASLIPPPPPDEIPATMDQVQIGSAVGYSEHDGGITNWFVIENTDKPSREFEEVAADSDIARQALGKRVGEFFVVAKSSVQDRVGKILQILSKYTRRFQVIGGEMQVTFGAQSVVQSIHIPTPEKLSATDLQPMLDDIKAHSEAVSKLREIYKSIAVPLHVYGERLGHTAFDALIDLASSEDDFIRCADPQTQALASALKALETKSTVVLDLTALASLYLLGITRQILKSSAFRFVMSPATFTELQDARAKTKFGRAHGTMYYQNGRHYITETSQEESDEQKSTFEEYMQCVTANVAITPVPQLATLPRRDILEQVLGRYGTESALLSLSPGYIWWTDDLVAAHAATSELGVERTWTQALIEHLATLGLIDRSLVEESYA